MNTPTTELSHLVFYANSMCNAHCVMCDVGRESDIGIARPLIDTPKYLGRELLEKILDDPLVAERTPKCNTYFIMTEPLLTPHLPELFKEAKDRGHAVYLTTNGLLLEKRAAEVAPYIDSIQISLDGPEELHDSIRGKGFFKAALAGLKAIRTLRPDVEIVINTTVFNLTAPHIQELAEILDEQDVHIDLFKLQGLDFVSKPMRSCHNEQQPDIPQTASTEGDVLQFDTMDFDALADQLVALREWNPKNIRKIGFKPPFTTAEELRKYYQESGNPMESWSSCATPWVAMAINTEGSCFFHTRCFNDYVIGNAGKQSLRDIFFGEKAEYLRDRLAQSNYCFPACSRCCGVTPLEQVEVSA